MNNILIGTSGYDYPEWKGIFYPEKLPRKDFLTYYSTQLNALELNNTFYGMPTKKRIESYIEGSEERLFFSIKVPKIFTHEYTSSWKSSAAELKAALSPQGGKIGGHIYSIHTTSYNACSVYLGEYNILFYILLLLCVFYG